MVFGLPDIQGWIDNIHVILTQNGSDNGIVPSCGDAEVSGPLDEKEFWSLRLLRLCDVVEQLKHMECRLVLGVVRAAKSKLISRWRTIDAALTEEGNPNPDPTFYFIFWSGEVGVRLIFDRQFAVS